jgi:hypothetical protein
MHANIPMTHPISATSKRSGKVSFFNFEKIPRAGGTSEQGRRPFVI